MSKHVRGADDDGFLDLNDFLDQSMTRYERPGLGKRLLGAAGALVAVALVSAAVVLPPSTLAATATGEVTDYWDELPSELPRAEMIPTYTVLLDKDGERFAQFYSENRLPVSLDDVSPHVIDALIATEDARFFTHGGIDPKGLLRAAAVNLGGGQRQGGSTITQQLAENIRLTHASGAEEEQDARAGSLAGKIQEAKYATALEERYSKEEILEMYLNTVYFGSGVYGIATAAERYYSVTPSELTVDQAATLVGLVKNPTGYDPIQFPERARERRDVVLGRMLTEGKITQAEYGDAVVREVVTEPGTFENGCYDSDYPLYCSYVQQELLGDPAFGETREEREYNLYMGGMTVQTALDRRVMDDAQAAVDEVIGRENRVATAVAVVEPGTGHVSAIAQNRTFGQDDGQTEVVYATSRFQTGSTFKPVTLAAAFESGFSPSTKMETPRRYSPANLDHPSDGFRNYIDRGFGVQDAYDATRLSTNTWYIKLVERVGVRETAEMAYRLGMRSVPQDLTGVEAAITLGSYESSPIEVASAYATFASGGIRCEPTPITKVTDSATGEERPAPDTACERAIMPGVAATVNELLQEPMKEGGTADGIDIGRQFAAKTGSANDYSAAWFAGHTPQRAVAVWSGDPRGGSRYPLQGVTTNGTWHRWGSGFLVSGPVWERVMESAVDGLPRERFPSASAGVLSLRSTDVPETRGMTVGVAVSTLVNAGLDVTISPDTEDVPDAAPDTVAYQSVSGGSVVLTLVTGSNSEYLGGVASPGSDEGMLTLRAAEDGGEQ